MVMKKFFILCLLVLSMKGMAQKFDGLALTPPLGWNSWNTFATNIDENLVRQVADSMVSSGMRDAGYQYIVIDDGWMTHERDAVTGDLVPDPVKFPGGLKKLIQYVHSKGLKFGIYNCAGTQTCGGYPGTRGYEYQDARFYAALEVDYLKYDWCYTDGIQAQEAYQTMSKAIRAAGRPMVFSLCEWGTFSPWKWAAPMGHLWRVSGDIYNCFDCIKDHGTWKSWGVTHILDMHPDIRSYAGPGHWNDLDMLEVGNGMTEAEDRSHFTLWALQCSPLMAGNDIRKMSAATKNILTNKMVIGINQDSLGSPAFLLQKIDSVDIWVKPLQNGKWAYCFFNRSLKPFTLTQDWKNFTDTLTQNSIDFATQVYAWQDAWLPKQKGDTRKPIKALIGAHDVLLLELSPLSLLKKSK
ncbi:MAG: hypothetical protein RLY16_406 [Bacteroidota bacterium]